MAQEVGPAGGPSSEQPARPRVPALGVLFVVAGVILLVSTYVPEVTFSKLWPLFLLLPLAILVERYLAQPKQAVGVLVPIGVLSYLTVFFLWLNLSSWANTATTWPHFLLAPAFGLSLLFLATRNTHLLVPITALTVVAVVFLVGMQRSRFAIAVALIAVGLVLILGPALRRRRG
jgi:hypothetical protein